LSQGGVIVTPPYVMYPEQTGNYQFIAHDGCNYTALDDVYIYVYPAPPVDPYADILSGCMPHVVHFSEGSPFNGQAYLWNFGDNDFNNLSYERNPVHIYEEAGSYDLTLTVTSIEGCQSTQVIPDFITVYPTPDSRFVAEPNIASIVEPMIFFDNLSTGGNYNYWYFGDGDSSTAWSPYHKYPEVGTYPVMLVVTSVNGCLDTSIYDVVIKDEFTFYAPTLFSPDNDGVNDMFRVYGRGIDPLFFQLIIYDRWGEIIFSTKKFDPEASSSEGWNGLVKGSNFAETGTYTWLAIYQDINGNVHEVTGAVTIIR
jgi:gliding motility-associated-like protein